MMRLINASLFTFVLISSGVRAGEFSIATEASLAGDLYETGYFCGIAPGYTLKFENDRELLCALVLRVRGDIILRSDYRQHTQFISMGGDIAWYRPLFIAKKIRILWGPETYYHYGLRPVTWRTAGEKTTREEYTEYFLHNGGITWPVRLDFRFAKHTELRLTERLLGVEADSRWVKGYDSTIKFKAGLTPMLSPVVSFIIHF
jgi:hypothetical protein